MKKLFLMTVLMCLVIAFTPAAWAQDEAPAADPAVALMRAVTGTAEGYRTEDEAGNPARVWFYRMGEDGSLKGIAHVIRYSWEDSSEVIRSDVMQFRIADANIIDIEGNYFILSFDGVIFRIGWETQQLTPAEW